MLPRFDPEKALEIIERDGVTVFQGVPTMYNAMLHASGADDADASTLELCMSGGAAIPVELIRGFEEKFGCIDPRGLRALGDLAGRILQPPGPRAQGRARSARRSRASRCRSGTTSGNELPQGEVGEIVIRGHNVMKGYWERPDATAEAIDADGWFRTGDMAKVDEDGYFFIVDRKKDMIIRGGYNVYPREVEEVLYEHPAVQEAAVVGVAATTRSARRWRRRSSLKAGESLDARSSRPTSRSRWRPTSTRARSGSSTSCRRARRARS